MNGSSGLVLHNTVYADDDGGDVRYVKKHTISM